LTIYKPYDLVRAPERCPRCDAWLRRRPATLFRAPPRREEAVRRRAERFAPRERSAT